jgi:enoyl-CoA hydratase/carnithine racemase
VPASLRIEELGGGVRCLKLSNPERKNALDAGSLRHLAEAVTAADAAHVRCWLVRSEGEPIFSSGYDVSALDAVGEGALPDDLLGEVLDLLQRHPAPSVALLTGPAFGAGCELACACDFRVGDTRAAFCLPPAKLGVVYAPRGIRRVAALTGLGRAKWMLLTGRKVEAAEAKEFGLLDVLTPLDFAEDGALELTQQLAAAAPLAVGGMKRIFAALASGGPTAEETEAIDGLRRAAFNSQDILEGRLAFLEKRKPKFSGK